jgi:RNA polymerase sigma factor (sigma-70 family)
MTVVMAKLDCSLRAVAESGVEMPLQLAAQETRALTQRLAKGEEAAFREFHESYFDPLYRFLLVVTRGQEHPAQEALQETLLRVARYVRVFDSEAVFWSWLKMVARSAARDAGRKQRRYAAMLERFTRFTGLWRQSPVQHSGDEHLLQEKLADALNQLAPGDRQLIEEKYLVGASTRELAAMTGLSEKAVESRLLRLRRLLRAELLEGLDAK